MLRLYAVRDCLGGGVRSEAQPPLEVGFSMPWRVNDAVEWTQQTAGHETLCLLTEGSSSNNNNAKEE